MARRSIAQLQSELSQLGKAASVSPESAVDPADKGTFSTEVPAEALKTDLPGPSVDNKGTLNKVPDVTPSEPAGKSKTTEESVAGEVPPAEPFQTSGKEAAAGVQERIGSLTSKLASAFATPAQPATPAAPVTPPAAQPSKEASAEKQPGDSLMKVAFHLMSTATGQALINSALDEVLGAEQTAELMKAAAEETTSFLAAYTQQRLAALDEQERQMKAAAARRQSEAEYQALIQGSTPEEIENMHKTAALVARAAALFEDHPIAADAFAAGCNAAQKVAAAMGAPGGDPSQGGGMPPEEAAAQAAGPQEGEPSPEEILQALQQLVQSGQISPEEAQQLVQELQQAMSGGGAQGASPEQAKAAAEIDAALDKIAAVIA